MQQQWLITMDSKRHTLKLFLITVFVHHCSANLKFRHADFKTIINQYIKGSSTTKQYFVRSEIECSAYCLETVDCCTASFTEENRKCIVDMSIGCNATQEIRMGSTLLEKKLVCKPQWEEINGRCILYSEEPRDQTEAEGFCIENGGKLFSIETAEENTWLKNTVQHLAVRFVLSARRISSSTFVWSDENGNQLPISYYNWFPWEPNGVYGEDRRDCIYFISDTGKWDNYVCDFQFLEPVICENV